MTAPSRQGYSPRVANADPEHTEPCAARPGAKLKHAIKICFGEVVCAAVLLAPVETTPLLSFDSLVSGQGCLDRVLLRGKRCRRLDGTRTQIRRKSRLVQNTADLAGKSGGITGWDEQHGVRVQVGNPTDPGRHHRQPRTQRSEEHTSELQSRGHIVCRLL